MFGYIEYPFGFRYYPFGFGYPISSNSILVRVFCYFGSDFGFGFRVEFGYGFGYRVW